MSSIYNHWIYNDYGATGIIDMLIKISENSKYFSLGKNKDSEDPNAATYHIIEGIDKYQFDFKASSLLYRESGCVTNSITNPASLDLAFRKFVYEIVDPVAKYTMSQLDKYRPRFNSEEAQNSYYALLSGYINRKIYAFPNVSAKRFEMVVQK